jgi:hypothetical protein
MKNARPVAVIALMLLVPIVTARAQPLGSARLNASLSNPSASLHWRTFSSSGVGLSFSFPTPPGTIEYRYSQCRPPEEGCTGPYYSWEITRTDAIDRGHIYWVAGFTAHENYGRESWPTDIASWSQGKKGYFADGSAVQAVEALNLSDGSRALIFKPGGISCDPGCTPGTFPYGKDRMAVINFAKLRNGFKDLVFYFEDATPLADI